MKKKLVTLSILILAVVICVLSLSGCATKFEQDAIATTFVGQDKVESNGGMAVVYGKYLYFINGFAGVDADNTYGEVVKGAIARIELSNGKPTGTPQIIVPQNVYGTDTKYGGISIYNDYIYYATTNPVKDGNGEPKSDEMMLMRTKVDGTNTETILEFVDHTVVWVVRGDMLTYVRSGLLHSVNLKEGKGATIVDKSSVGSDYIITDNYLFYVSGVDGDTENSIIKAYPLAGGKVVELLSSEMLRATDTETNYKLTILKVMDKGDTINLFYTKSDNETPKKEEGIFSFEFKKSNNFAFDKTAEVRYSKNPSTTTNLSYSNFTEVANYNMVTEGNNLMFFEKGTSDLLVVDESILRIDMGGAITIKDVKFVESEGYYIVYQNSEKALYELQLFDTTGAYVEANATCLFKGTYNETYVTMEIIGDVIYYLNDKVSNTAYYYAIPAIDTITAETDLVNGRILGVITDTDKIAAL